MFWSKCLSQQRQEHGHRAAKCYLFRGATSLSPATTSPANKPRRETSNVKVRKGLIDLWKKKNPVYKCRTNAMIHNGSVKSPRRGADLVSWLPVRFWAFLSVSLFRKETICPSTCRAPLRGEGADAAEVGAASAAHMDAQLVDATATTTLRRLSDCMKRPLGTLRRLSGKSPGRVLLG